MNRIPMSRDDADPGKAFERPSRLIDTFVVTVLVLVLACGGGGGGGGQIAGPPSGPDSPGSGGGDESPDPGSPPPSDPGDPPPSDPPADMVCADGGNGMLVPAAQGTWRQQDTSAAGGDPIGRIVFLTPEIGRAVIHDPFPPVPPAILTTTDGGTTWMKVDVEPNPGVNVGGAFGFTSPNVGFVGGQGCTLVRTTDGGATWTAEQLCTSGIFFLTADFPGGREGWIGGGKGHLFHTTDGGDTWDRVMLPPDVDQPISGLAFAGDKGVVVENDLPALFVTMDGGATWGPPEDPGTNLGLREADFVDANTAVAVGAQVIVRTTDGGQCWTQVTRTASQLNNVEFGAGGFGVAVGDNGLILVTADGGASWTSDDSGVDWSIIGVSVLDSGHAWVSAREGILVREP